MKIVKNTLLGFSILLTFTSCKLTGKYVYKKGFYESIYFKTDNTFDSRNANDVGESKGYGVYEVKKGKVILTYTDPPIKNDPSFLIDTLDYIEESPSRFPDLYYVNRNFINLSIVDKKTKQLVPGGNIQYRSLNGTLLGGNNFISFSGTKIKIDKIDFPLILQLDCLGYLEYEFLLTEKKGYEITVGLINVEGYHKRSGEKIFNKNQFKNRKQRMKQRSKDLREQKFYRVE